MKARELPLVGWREWIAFPRLGIQVVKAKVDTGARSSSLHAVRLKVFKKNKREWIEFVVHPEQRSSRKEIVVRAPLVDERLVRSSNGKQELRPIIQPIVALGGDEWDIEVTLASRASMGFRVLLGREAVRRRYLVDPGRSFLLSKKRKKAR